MRRLIDLLAPAGAIVILFYFVWTFGLQKTLPGRTAHYVAAGAALMLAHLILRWEDVFRVVGGRRLRYGGNTLVMVLAVLGILGLLNYLVNQNDKRWDLTKNQRYSLSDQTRKILAGLKQDVTVWYFQRSGTPGMETGRDRLQLYAEASPRLKVEFVDPVANPSKAVAYDARGPWPVIVLEQAGRRERITNDAEQDVTNGLVKLTREGKRTVCFVEGEGERDPDDGGEHGYSHAKAALARSQYEVKKVLLLREKKVPADCTVLAVAGPQKDLLPLAVDAIREYVKGGGKALVLIEPPFKEPSANLSALLKEWNVETAPDVVVDASGVGQLFGAGPVTPIVAPPYPWHEITKDFKVATAFDTVRTVEPGTATAEGTTVQKLLETSPMSWAETDLTLKDPIEASAQERKGPLSLGVAVTLKVQASPSPAPSPSPAEDASANGTPESKPEARVVAVGDADFASNAMLGFQGNSDLFQNMVAWLSQDVDLISIRPREPDDHRMVLTPNQMQKVMLLALAVIPGVFVVLGVVNWWRRR